MIIPNQKSIKLKQKQKPPKDTDDEDKLLQNYKINMDMKNKLDQMTAIERNERKYGLLVRNDPDYLNPVLS